MSKAKNVWKPTSEECRTIRAFACAEARRRHVIIRPGLREHLEDETRESSMNILLVADNAATWSDTDLADQRDWADFKKGVPLNAEGRAIVDFYVYSTGEELLTNVTVYYATGKVVHLKGV